MRRIILLAFVCSILFACNQTQEGRVFDKFKKNIPHLKLPYKRSCSDSITHLKLDIPDNLFKKFAPTGASGVIGIIVDTDFYSAILFSVSGDIEYPVIQTYDPDGTKLNDLTLISGTCCGDADKCTGFSWGSINADRSITLRDSELVFEKTGVDKYDRTKFTATDKTEVDTLTDHGYIRPKGPQPVQRKEKGI
jgi:hypothetical protein